jgi:alkaline phosphatase D
MTDHAEETPEPSPDRADADEPSADDSASERADAIDSPAGGSSTGGPTGNGHARLADRLASGLALPATPTEPDDASVFEIGDVPAGTGFPQSVASGDPTPEGVVCWTRLDPDRYDPETPVGIEVVAEESFEDFEDAADAAEAENAENGERKGFGNAEVVYRGVVTDAEIVAAHDHTLKIDLEGELDPDRSYYYRFVHDGYHSRVGRCTTLPEPGASVEELSFAVVTCQDYQNGYYGAYAHIAEEDVDFLLHVGDFVYESADGQFAGRSGDFPNRDVTHPSGHNHAWELADYRNLYRTYRRDPHCQRAWRRHTVIAGRDDHEVADNLYWDYEADAPGSEHPRGDDPEFMQGLTADAIHAWWEFMPVDIRYDLDTERLHERFRVWRTFEFGDLLELIVTDERLFRSPPREGLPTKDATDPDNEPPGRTMLGDEQREWFVEEVTTSETLWTVWCDEVLTVPFRVGAGRASLYPVPGSWDGYTRERREIGRKLDRAGVSNFVTLTGDMHCYIAGYKQTEYRDAIGTRRDGPVPESDRLGVELMTPAMTSVTVAEGLKLGGTPLEEPVGRAIGWGVRAQNPHIEYFDSHHNGYSVVEFTPEACTYAAYAVDKTTNSRSANKELLAAYRVPEGQVDLENVTAEKRAEEAESNRRDAGGNGAGRTNENGIEAERDVEERNRPRVERARPTTDDRRRTNAVRRSLHSTDSCQFSTIGFVRSVLQS